MIDSQAQEKLRILEKLRDEGIAISHADILFSPDEYRMFEANSRAFKQMLDDKGIKERLKRIMQNNPIRDKGKYYEITHYHYLHRALNLGDVDFINLYLSKSFREISTEYLEAAPKLRNVLVWLMAQQPPSQNPCGAQNWHRDTEGHKVLKAWIYYNDITPSNGAAQYVKWSAYGRKNSHIYKNLENEVWTGWNTQLDEASSSQIPPEDIVSATGNRGTIVFVDTNGFHRGNRAIDNIRMSTHAVYVRPDARQIISGPITHFNHDPKVNDCDFSSEQFLSMKKCQQDFLL
jgi:hypothetical protein